LGLLGIINDVYALILDANPLKTIDAHKHALEMLAKQTAECAYFISHYAGAGSGGGGTGGRRTSVSMAGHQHHPLEEDKNVITQARVAIEWLV
jgi:hypothetical protein